MTQDEAYKKFRAKLKALKSAAETVESILGVVAEPSLESVSFYRRHESTKNDHLTDVYEGRRLMVLVNQNETGGTLYCDGSDNVATDEHWHHEMAPWKAAVLEELRVLLPLTQEESGYWDNAVAIFRGEVMHPAVLLSIR